MASIDLLLNVADAYKAASGLSEDTTVSHRVFGDSKKLRALRSGGADITVGRYNSALRWFRENWPEAVPLPPALATDTGSAA